MSVRSKEDKLRGVIRQTIQETLFGKDFCIGSTFVAKGGDEKIGSFSSETARIIIYRESDESVYMKVINKRTGKTSDKIYIENVEELQDVLDIVNVIT